MPTYQALAFQFSCRNHVFSDGERFGRILDRHVDLAVRGLPPNIVEQLEDKSTEDICEL